jgi:hypothetical protein
MGSFRVASARFGRRLRGLLTAPRGARPVADVEPRSDAATANGTADPAAPADVPSFRNRARLRRRLRYLRQTRELGFRDLGGFVFDSRRLGREREDIVQAKFDALAAIDRELRALEHALEDVEEVTLLREPGVSVCPRCGALHGSEDNYCPGCALPVGRGLGLAIAQHGPGGAVVPGGPAVESASPEQQGPADAKPDDPSAPEPGATEDAAAAGEAATETQRLAQQ